MFINSNTCITKSKFWRWRKWKNNKYGSFQPHDAIFTIHEDIEWRTFIISNNKYI